MHPRAPVVRLVIFKLNVELPILFEFLAKQSHPKFSSLIWPKQEEIFRYTAILVIFDIWIRDLKVLSMDLTLQGGIWPRNRIFT